MIWENLEVRPLTPGPFARGLYPLLLFDCFQVGGVARAIVFSSGELGEVVNAARDGNASTITLLS